MLVTVIPNRETTKKTWCKTFKTNKGERIVTIEGEKSTDDNTTRRIRIVTNTEGVKVATRDRKNETATVVNEDEAMNQLHQARRELQDEAKKSAEGERDSNRGRDEAEYAWVDKTDYTNTKTEEEHKERIKRRTEKTIIELQ